MARSRRSLLFSIGATALIAAQQQPEQHAPRIPPANPDEDEKLPNGKSQKDAIAKEEHERALKDTGELIAIAEQLKDELQKAGNYVVPFGSVKKTEEIEKLARRIRGHLKQ